ncbi:MAG: Mycothiol maleylpyruvate isomerase-like protein [Actinomycetia bacterium]|nr:Mycothiol maleylpyruvate isomerase-like protein [Actinomycetes bacterium]
MPELRIAAASHRPGAVIERSHEADAFLATIGDAAPEAVSACDGWTTHDIAAHVTGIAVEVIRHLEPYLQGDPVPRTRSFEEREAPLQATGHLALLSRLDAEEERMRRLVGDVLGREPDAVIPWTGRRMGVVKFIPHLRNEHALHRWDIAGDDEVSRQFLGSMDLVGHSVGELGRILLAAGRRHDPDPDSEFHVRLRAEGQPDLRVVVENGDAGLAWASDEADEASVDFDAGARQLFIWGRRPDHRGRLRSHLTQPDLARLQALLSGY